MSPAGYRLGTDLGGTGIKRCLPEFIVVQNSSKKLRLCSDVLSNNVFRNSTRRRRRKNRGAI